MDSIFRKDVYEQECAQFFQHCFSIPKYLNMKYYFPAEEQISFNKELLFKNNLRVTLPLLNNNKFMIECFLKGCFKKCKQFVLDDYVDFDEIDCTMKCASKTKESYEILENILIPNNKISL